MRISTVWLIAISLPAFCADSRIALADDPEPGRKRLQVQIVDESGTPVPQAKVTPWAIGSSAGHGLWQQQHGKAAEALTDSQGCCEVHYPEIHLRDLRSEVISVRVEHPDYCVASVHLSLADAPPDGPSKVTLRKGTRLRVGVADENGILVEQGVRLLIEGDWRPRRAVDAGPGLIMTGHMPAEVSMLFAAVIVEDQPVRFAGPHFWKPGEEFVEVILTQQDPVRLRGRLAENVPRPVLHGQVSVQAVVPLGAQPAWTVWSDVTPIAEDGSFEFPSLPRGTDAQLIAICDGFLNEKPTLVEIANLGRRFEGQARLNVNVYEALPVVVEVGNGDDSLIVPMRETHSLSIRVINPEGQPVPGVEVSAWPNQFHFGVGSNLIGDCFPTRSIPDVANPDWTEIRETKNRSPMTYQAKSDERGIAVLKSFPAGSHSVAIKHPDWELRTGGNIPSIKIDAPQTTTSDIVIYPKPK